MAENFFERVHAVVKRIPRGKVASYGLVAALAGSPRAARQVGFALRLGRGLPWWRVVSKDGRIVIQDPEYRFAQHAKLVAEGIPVVGGAVDYERFSWKPRGGAPPRSPARPARKAPASRAAGRGTRGPSG